MAVNGLVCAEIPLGNNSLVSLRNVFESSWRHMLQSRLGLLKPWDPSFCLEAPLHQVRRKRVFGLDRGLIRHGVFFVNCC